MGKKDSSSASQKEADKIKNIYAYKPNSNLVLQHDKSLQDQRPRDEATGEMQSLVGRLTGRMGDKLNTTKPTPLIKHENKELKKRKKDEPSKLKLELNDPRNYSIADIETKDLLYQPKSELTAQVYGLVIKFVRKQLGFQHNSIINGAADEVISAMKDPSLTEEEKKSMIEDLLSPEQSIDDGDYNELSNLCKKINDWDSHQTKIKDDMEPAEEESGETGVIFVDEDDVGSEDDFVDEVRESDDDAVEEMLRVERTKELTAFAPMEIQEDTLDSKYTSINLDDLSKRQSINPRIELMEPIRKEGYQEYCVEPRKHKRHDALRKIKELPENESYYVQEAFGKHIESLNLIQGKIYDRAIRSDDSLLICAPTGAGKTNIAVLTMLREILKHPKESGFDIDKFKIIYIAPIKALVQEIVENFKQKLGKKSVFNLRVEELTGDRQLNQSEISQTQIIVCTPEKWDIITRKSQDRLYTKLVRLVIFDEIHLLHNERGATLEALVTRIKRHKQIEGQSIRVIGLSATLPNYSDVAYFIAPGKSVDRSTFYFDNSFRPVPLRQQYIALTATKKAFKINDIVYEKVLERLNAQILIFVHSRPETAKTADYIKEKASKEDKIGRFLSSESALERINADGKRLGSKLKELLQFGIGIHHAGLTLQERSCVEELFRGKYIKVLVSTATLAWGVNLPARTVIIKGTEVYRDGRWTNLDSLDVTQMLGRAGRPGLDTEGEGIVITQQAQVSFYMSLMTEQLPVESKLISRLPEFINAECVVGSIECLDDAVSWLSETYLNSRMLSVVQNSENKQYLSLYGIDQDAARNDPKLTSHKYNLAYTAACLLDDRGLIIFDRHTGAIESTELGRIASHYNCSSRTIKLFHDSIHEHTSDIELFRTFSLADEFKDIFVRRGEEVDFQTLLNQVPFPIDDKRATPGANKVNALLQVYIFRLNIEGSDLISDMHFIRENAARLARAIHEIVLMKGLNLENGRTTSYALVAELSLDLCRKIDKRMTVCHSPLRQFSEDLDLDIITRLEKKNYHIDELRMLKEDKITELLRCDRRQGEKVYKYLKYLPKVKIEASVKPISKTSIEIELTIRPDFTWHPRYHGSSERFCLLVEDVNQEVLLHYEMIHLRENNPSNKIKTTFCVRYLTPTQPFYFIRLFPDGWFGCDQHLPIYMEKLSLPDESSIITQLPDLELQTIRSLGNVMFERAYEDKFRGGFNQIQTHAFQHLYLKDDDIILLASAGSGKTTCAELAIIRNINLRGTASKSAYICANYQSAQLVYENWVKLFGKHYGVTLLTGNYRTDAAKVSNDNTNIVIGDPYSWHVLTLPRYRKYRKLLSKFQLYILDDLHLLHNDKDSILEWLCSKIRFIAKTDGSIRIVSLGSPMTCADSLKSWLAFERGSKEPTLLNYPLSIRPVKLELTFQKHYHYDYRMRIMTMQRPVYRYVTHTAKGKPVLVFVPDFLQALELCESLTTYAKSEGRLHLFGRPSGTLTKIHDRKLKDYLLQGVGYLYRGMHDEDRQNVESLYESGQVQIVVATVGMCWSMQCRSYLTVIMDTQQFDGIETMDYALTDIMQMVGLTGRPLVDHECRCIILCQSSKADSLERFLSDPLPVESDLPANLISHVNYEVAAGALTELNSIYKPYLAHTFFYKRITINPNYYGIILPEDYDERSQVFTTFFNNLVNKVALELEETDFINMEGSHENPNFSPGLLSQISLGHYINYETLVSYTKSLDVDFRPLEMIELLSAHTFEFRQIPVRHGDLQVLRGLQDRYKMRDKNQPHPNAFKIKLLILSQYQLTSNDQSIRDDFLEGELIEDRRFVIRMCHRLLMAIVDIAYIKDSFKLLKTAIQLSKRLIPFTPLEQGGNIVRLAQPNLDMEVNVVKDGEQITLDVIVNRENEQFSIEEFKRLYELPVDMYRDEGWCFLVHGRPISKNDKEKLLLFERVKTPAKGSNEYKLGLTLPDDSKAYTYDLYLMSDFYEISQDRKVPNVEVQGSSNES